MSWMFSQLCADMDVLPSGDDVEINAITHDSRQVAPGTLFVALRGATPQSRDGHDYVDEAISLGASAVLTETPIAVSGRAHACVADTRLALAHLAELIAGEPSRQLSLIGVTGTNGKTTTVHMIAAGLDACGMTCGVLGTLGVTGPRIDEKWAHTTPEAPLISSTLARLVAAGARATAMEVSSHALALKRVDGLRFKVAAFTNLTHDHLDFHGDMETYLAAKKRLFCELLPEATGRAVIHTGDTAGKQLAVELGDRAVRVGVGTDPTLHIAATAVTFDDHGTKGSIRVDKSVFAFSSRHVGLFNLENMLVACGVAYALGLDMQKAIAGLGSCAPVNGRLQPLSDELRPAVLVDYAHTPDALERVLKTASALCRGRVIVVFGCGGDRDKEKRASMGHIAARCADEVVITDDNPRFEDARGIVDAIEAGTHSVEQTRAQHVAVIRDRAEAIYAAVHMAADEDVVVIAGKGHEDYQLIREQRLPFSDREVALRALQQRNA